MFNVEYTHGISSSSNYCKDFYYVFKLIIKHTRIQIYKRNIIDRQNLVISKWYKNYQMQYEIDLLIGGLQI